MMLAALLVALAGPGTAGALAILVMRSGTR